MSDDYVATTQTTGTVSVGGSVTGNIHEARDQDWFAVTLEANKIYMIDLEGSPTNKGTLSDTYLHGVFDSDGDRVSNTRNDDGGVGRNSRLSIMPDEDGVYYISAGAYNSFGNTGTYTLSIEEVTDDYIDQAETTGMVAVDGSVMGEIETRGDQDWFKVELVGGTTYQIDLEGSPTNEGTLNDPYIRGIYNSNSQLIRNTSNDDGGHRLNSKLSFTPTEDGTYYIAAGAAGSRLGTYKLSVTDMTVDDSSETPMDSNDDFVATTSTTGSVVVGGSAMGEIEADGDQDWFAVELEGGTAYRIDLEGWRTDGGTLYNPYFRGVHDSDGNLILGTTSDYGGIDLNARITFTPTDHGTYYLAAGANSGVNGGPGVGTYTISVREDGDDFTAGTDTAGSLTVGVPETGEIEDRNDRDWFAVELEAGQAYQFDAEPVSASGNRLIHVQVQGIYDADGNMIPNTASREPVTYTPTEAGTYYVSIGNTFGIGEGPYQVSAVALDDDFKSATTTTGMVTVGGSVMGEIQHRLDQDWFAVTLNAGQSYWIDLEGSSTSQGTLNNPYLRGIYDSSGDMMAGTTDNSSGTGLNSRVSFTPVDGGTYYISAGANGLGEGTYKLSVRADSNDDFHASDLTSGTITIGESTTGEIESDGDQDWFAVELQSGTTYQFNLEGNPTNDGTLINPKIWGIYDSSGNMMDDTVDNNSGYSLNARVEFTPESSGTYYVVAGSVEEFLGGPSILTPGPYTGTYTISASISTESGVDDFVDTSSTTGEVEVGGSATGEINWYGDLDWFKVELEADTRYQIDLEGVMTDKGSLSDPYLRGVYGSDGGVLRGSIDDDGGTGRNSRATISTTESGTYYISAGAFTNGTGTYTVTVTNLDADDDDSSTETGTETGTGTETETPVVVADDFTATMATTGTVAVSGSSSGNVESVDDRDWFAVELSAGRAYQFDLKGSSSGDGTLTDPSLYGIYGVDGTLFTGTSSDAGGVGYNAQVAFTPDATGTYYVAAGASGSGTGTYTLEVSVQGNEEGSSDYASSTSTSGSVAVGGTASGMIDERYDQDWFAVTLEANTIYQIDLEGSVAGDNSVLDTFLRGIYNSNGHMIPGTRNDDGGVGYNSRVTFTPDEGGTYYIAAGAFGPATGDYTVSVTSMGERMVSEDDFPNTTSTTGMIAVGGSAWGNISSRGDQDWFAAVLEAGTTYQIDLEGEWTHAGTLLDPYLRGVYDSNGSMVSGTTDDDGGFLTNSRVSFTPSADGTYYIAAGAYGSHEGTYMMSLSEDM